MLQSDGILPIELINNSFWQWAWFILFTFVTSGAGWFLGYVIYLPMTMLMSIYNFAVVIYSTGLLLFETPQRLSAQEWLFYPVRRWLIEGFIISSGFFWLAIPGVSIIVMPLLGLWYANDFLDYQGFDQLGRTLGIPFNGYNSVQYT